jgi:hypothetical protein
MPEALRVATFWAAMVLVASHLGLALAAAGIPALTALVGPRAVKRLRIFTDKFGQQAATFALLGGLWALVALSGLLVAAGFLAPVGQGPWRTAPAWLAVTAPLAVGAAVFLAYRGLWHRLKARKQLHVLLGLAATLLFWLAFYVGLAALRPLAVPGSETGWAAWLAPPGTALFWRLLAEGVVLSLFTAGTFTGAWLVWRRNRDDFGRDYYNFTMRLTARLGFWAGLASLGAMVWVCLGLLPVVGEISSRMTLALGLYGLGMLVTLGGCGFLAGQENALRHKFLLVLAFLGSVVALTGLLAGLSAVFWPGL